jgi:hypothetical protein
MTEARTLLDGHCQRKPLTYFGAIEIYSEVAQFLNRTLAVHRKNAPHQGVGG